MVRLLRGCSIHPKSGRKHILPTAICLAVGLVLSGFSPGASAVEREIVVAADGSGDFHTVQEAIASAPADSRQRTVIHIRPGTYQGQIVVPREKTAITFLGDDAGRTTLTYSRNVREPDPDSAANRFPGTGVVILGDNFQAENITFENTSGDHGQAMALRIDGDRARIRNCRLLGWQDTLLLSRGRQYFRESYIEGRVDFIYGAATAVFDQCEIHSKNGGHITAASTPQDHPFGFVFLDCRLTGDPTPWRGPASLPRPLEEGRSEDADNPPAKKPPQADLGRPWRPFASVTYINCWMGDHIKPEGWNNWRNPENEKTARYTELGSRGPGANPSQRVGWSKQLAPEAAAGITVEHALSGTDGWKPQNAE